MLSRRFILRRLVAWGGIVLSLAASLQESHTLCALGNCTTQSCCERDDAHLKRKASVCGCCCHKPDVSPQASGCKSYEPCHEPDPDVPRCYSAWNTDRDVPRTTGQSVNSQSTFIYVAISSHKIGAEAAGKSFRANTSPWGFANSTGEICARLCRFLT
jgi:hypothetical protein